MFSILPSKLAVRSQVRSTYNRSRIGSRDVVGYGKNGIPTYQDSALFPFPAVRFMDNNHEVVALRQKEKGDWRLLNVQDKKALYRASFCQTFAEFQAPTGSWKFVAGWVLICLSSAFWMQMFMHYFVHEPLPSSLSQENQLEQLKRMIQLHVGNYDGLSSKWDYSRDYWKGLTPNVRPKCVKPSYAE